MFNTTGGNIMEERTGFNKFFQRGIYSTIIAFAMTAFLGLGNAAIATPLNTITTTVQTNPQDNNADYIRWRLAALMNDHRESLGLTKIDYNTELNNLAQEWADYSAANNASNHNPFFIQKMTSMGYQYSGENFASTSYAIDPGYVMHRNFLASPGHKANMEKVYWNNVGIGVAQANGRTYVAVNFGYDPTEKPVFPVSETPPLVNGQEPINYNWTSENPHPFFKNDNLDLTLGIQQRNATNDEYTAWRSDARSLVNPTRGKVNDQNLIQQFDDIIAANDAARDAVIPLGLSVVDELDLINGYIRTIHDNMAIADTLIEEIIADHEDWTQNQEIFKSREEYLTEYAKATKIKNEAQKTLNSLTGKVIDNNTITDLSSVLGEYSSFPTNLDHVVKDSSAKNFINNIKDYSSSVKTLEEKVKNSHTEWVSTNTLRTESNNLLQEVAKAKNIYTTSSGKVLSEATRDRLNTAIYNAETIAKRGTKEKYTSSLLSSVRSNKTNLALKVQDVNDSIKAKTDKEKADKEKTDAANAALASSKKNYEKVLNDYNATKKKVDAALKNYKGKASSSSLSVLSNQLKSTKTLAVSSSTLKTASAFDSQANKLNSSLKTLKTRLTSAENSYKTWVALDKSKKAYAKSLTSYKKAYSAASKTYKASNKKASSKTRSALKKSMATAKKAAVSSSKLKTKAKLDSQKKKLDSAVKNMNSKRSSVIKNQKKTSYAKVVKAHKKADKALTKALKQKTKKAKKTKTYKSAVSYQKKAKKTLVASGKLKTNKAIDKQIKKVKTATKNVKAHTKKVKRLR